MNTHALVLGGGGPVGIAWETGLLAGLADAGMTLAKADFILGTSAGSFVGAQLASGWPVEKMYAAQMALGRAEAAGKDGAPTFDISSFHALVAKMPTDSEPSIALRQEFGALARTAHTMPLDAYRTIFESFAQTSWPARFGCTAVDADSGAFHVFTAADAAPLADAIAASCSVPGIFPPPPIHGRMWMDGGVRSATSIDHAGDHARIVCLAVVTPLSGPIIAGQLARETSNVEAKGGRAIVIAPRQAALATFPANLMNAEGRSAIAEAGFAQGRAEASRLGDFLN
jgi:NTE family protein